MKKQLTISFALITSLLIGLVGTQQTFGQAKMASSNDCLSGNCFCIQGSVDFMNVTFSSSGSSETNKSRTGFNLGVYMLHPFPTTMTSGGLALKVGLEFVEKGFKYDDGAGDKETFGLSYLEIPINILYEYKLANCGAIFGGLGPYLAYGLGGKDKITSSGQSYSSNSFSDSAAKRFDFGLNITAGYHMSCTWSASISYEAGLINIYNNPSGSSSYTAKNHGWSINVAYCLGDLFKK